MKKNILLILIIIWAIGVFLLSSQDAINSSDLSGGITAKVVEIMKIPFEYREVAHGIIRKLAHFTLYFIGGSLIFLYNRCFEITLNRKIIIAQLCGSIYAITDEIHQLFVPGRAGMVRDVLLDSLGVLVGIVLMIIFLERRNLNE